MKNFKGTKGEWVIDNIDSSYCTDIVSGNKRIAEVKHYNDPKCPDNYFTNDPMRYEGKANAKLIAAAPDLLAAALKALEECCDLIATEAGNALELAIKKATE